MTFKEYIKDHNISNTDMNDMKGLYCRNMNLTDLNGIESFTDLTHLDCSYNNLTDLKGIESLTDLTHLYCNKNNITSLKEIDQLKKLKTIYSDITNNIEDARSLILSEIRRDKISDI